MQRDLNVFNNSTSLKRLSPIFFMLSNKCPPGQYSIRMNTSVSCLLLFVWWSINSTICGCLNLWCIWISFWINWMDPYMFTRSNCVCKRERDDVKKIEYLYTSQLATKRFKTIVWDEATSLTKKIKEEPPSPKYFTTSIVLRPISARFPICCCTFPILCQTLLLQPNE